MAISFVQYQVSNNTTGGTSSTATFTNPIAAGSVIAVAVVADQGKTFTFSDGLGDTATDCGIGVNNDAGIGTAVQIVAFLSATAGAQTVTVTPTSGWTFLEIAIWEIAGLTVAAWDKTAHTTGGSTSATSTNTPTLSAANEAAIGYGIGNAAYSAAGSGWTGDTVPTSFGDLTQHQITSSTAPIASTGTLSSSVTWHMYCATLMSTGVAPSVAGPGRSTPRIFRPHQGPSRGLRTPRSTFIPASGTTGSGDGASAGIGAAQAVGAALFSGVAASSGVGTASGVSVVGVTIDAFSSGATSGGWASGSLGRAADLDGFGSPTNDSPVTVNQGFGFITIGSGATALLFGVSMASQTHGSNNPGTLTVTLNPSGSNQTMTQLGTLVDQGGTQKGPTYLFGLVSPASGTGNIRIAWTNFTNIQEFYVYAMSFTGTSTASVAAAFYGLNTANDGGTAGATNQVSTSVPVASGDMAFALHINAANGFRQPADNATGTEMDNDQHITNNSYGQYFTGAGSVITARADNTSPFGTTDFWSASVVAIGTAPAGASVAASTGTGAANGVGAALFSGVGATGGTGAATGVGQGIANSVGASAGTGTATGVGASTLAGDGVASSVGQATVTGVSAALAASVGASAGTGSATGVGAELAASTAATAGTGAATGVGASLAASIGASSGVGTALGVGDSQAAGQSVGASAGTSTVLGVGASIWAAIGNASGTAIVVGASPVTEQPAGGAGIVMHGTAFTRKRWEELQALIAAEQAVAAKAAKVGNPARAEALAEASGKAKDAISALEAVEGREAYESDMARLRTRLAAATSAKKVTDSIREAKEAAVLAEKLQAEADEEYEIMLLMDDGPEAAREMERIVAMMAAITGKQ